MVDGRTMEHGYTICSPCEPLGSGELNLSQKASYLTGGAKLSIRDE